MNAPYRRRSRAHLDRVIDGRASRTDPLIGLVRQIQSPPRRSETRGLRAASSAFVWAPSARPYLPPHHRTGLTSAAALLWHPKVLAAGLTLIVAASIAIAATGNLPTTGPTPATVVAGGMAARLSAAQGSASVNSVQPPSAQRRPTPAASVTPPTGAAGSSTATPTTTATADSWLMTLLCRQWFSRPSGSATPSNGPFGGLINELGGVGGLNAYCNALLTHRAPLPSLTFAPRGLPSTGQVPTTPTPTATPTPTG